MKKNGETHGLCRSPLYGVWVNMKSRCKNQNTTGYKNYGGRGIKVCKRWEDFLNFYEDMKDGWENGLTIERIDNDGNYEPKNCKWATYLEQSRNKRNFLPIFLNGKRMTKQDLASELGCSDTFVGKQIRKGIKPENIKKSTFSKGKRKIQQIIDGKVVKVWDSQTEASKDLGIKQEKISHLCIGRDKQFNEFELRFC